MLQEELIQKPHLRKFLFIRGFLVTECQDVSGEGFPFYGNWNHRELAGYHFWLHPLTGFHSVTLEGKTAFLLGHCYNPFTMESTGRSLSSGGSWSTPVRRTSTTVWMR